ncbi:MAG: geranylgeranyl reductase family protein [Verrucomicrobiota bacterium]
MRAAAKQPDVIIVGAGPAGSSVATFLARAGVSCLLLERHHFPRDKVCGDGLTPQALYWLEQLGCADAVLELTDCCIKACDLYINGKYVFSGRFPEHTPYPPFCTLLDRKRLDHLLVQNAVAHGATLLEGVHVRNVVREEDGISVEATVAGSTQHFHAKLLVGADGAGSVVSRFLGNSFQGLTKAVSVRAYYEGVEAERSLVRVYFNEEFFPGYAWIFLDDHGHANVGLGCVCDGTFPLRINVKEAFQAFVAQDLGDVLAKGKLAGGVTGGWAAYCRPAARCAERVLLVGDAANSGDPLNGGGIHKAFESGALAAGFLRQVLTEGDFSAGSMARYDQVLEKYWGVDWQSAELLLTIAKNPHFRLLYLQLLEHLGELTRHDPRFADFASGIFTGMVPQSWYLSPLALLSAFPRNPQAWLSLVTGNDGTRAARSAAAAARGVIAGLRSLLAHPAGNLAWALEVGAKSLDLGWALTAQSMNSIGTLPQQFGWPTASFAPGAEARFNPVARRTTWQ